MESKGQEHFSAVENGLGEKEKSIKKAIKRQVNDQKLNFPTSAIKGGIAWSIWHQESFNPLCWQVYLEEVLFHVRSRKAHPTFTWKTTLSNPSLLSPMVMAVIQLSRCYRINLQTFLLTGHFFRLYMNWTPTETGLTKYLQNLIPSKTQQIPQVQECTRHFRRSGNT